MKHLKIILFVTLVGVNLFHTIQAQNSDVLPDSVIIYNRTTNLADTFPEFTGGKIAMFEFIQKQIIYPLNALRRGVKGDVIILFVVDQDGSIKNAIVGQGIGGGCDEEALRVVKKMPTWIPGTKNGKPVPVRQHLKITFDRYIIRG